MERIDLVFSDVYGTIADIENNYSTIDTVKIKQAIKNGALGKYGRTYRLSTQEVCIWIDSYLKENPSESQKNLQQRKTLGL